MKRMLCVQDFGLTKRGDFVLIPDDAEASPLYFVEAPEEEEAPAEEEEATEEETEAEAPPAASKKARGSARPTDDKKKDEG
jgi:hypothetical protein